MHYMSKKTIFFKKVPCPFYEAKINLKPSPKENERKESSILVINKSVA